jgi:1,4-alpha-glucan branching enzyme
MGLILWWKENLDTISFLKFNEAVYSNFEGVQTIAEEYFISWFLDQPLLVVWGLGWMMGWMHDTLEYFQKIRCIESTIK